MIQTNLMNMSVPTNSPSLISKSVTVPIDCYGEITYEVLLKNGVGGLIGFGIMVNGNSIKGYTIYKAHGIADQFYPFTCSLLVSLTKGDTIACNIANYTGVDMTTQVNLGLLMLPR